MGGGLYHFLTFFTLFLTPKSHNWVPIPCVSLDRNAAVLNLFRHVEKMGPIV
jgi:hypothetical protein